MATGRSRIQPNFYYGTIEAAVRDRASTADMWSRIRDQAEAAGLASPGLSMQEASRMRAQAARTRTADEQLTHATPSRALDAGMISRARWVRDDARREAAPSWQIRFQLTTIQEGVEVTEWRNLVIRGSLPATVADLHRRVGRAAAQLAKDYEAEYVGFGDLSILEV